MSALQNAPKTKESLSASLFQVPTFPSWRYALGMHTYPTTKPFPIFLISH